MNETGRIIVALRAELDAETAKRALAEELLAKSTALATKAADVLRMLRADVELIRPMVEAAIEWRNGCRRDGIAPTRNEDVRLLAAVDAALTKTTNGSIGTDGGR